MVGALIGQELGAGISVAVWSGDMEDLTEEAEFFREPLLEPVLATGFVEVRVGAVSELVDKVAVLVAAGSAPVRASETEWVQIAVAEVGDKVESVAEVEAASKSVAEPGLAEPEGHYRLSSAGVAWDSLDSEASSGAVLEPRLVFEGGCMAVPWEDTLADQLEALAGSIADKLEIVEFGPSAEDTDGERDASAGVVGLIARSTAGVVNQFEGSPVGKAEVVSGPVDAE